MTSPWIRVRPLTDAEFARVRRRAIFDCHKWDPQVGDCCSIARYPLVIEQAAWREVSRLAERLAVETLAAEEEIVERLDLHARLGLPWAIRRVLSSTHKGSSSGVARLMRFDFHHTPEGWRVSEVNSDVPGGLNEASGFSDLMVDYFPWARPVGDPVTSYVEAL